MSERQKTRNRHGNGAFNLKSLRHIPDAGRRQLTDLAAIGRLDAEDEFNERRLASTIGSDQGHDFIGADIKIDRGQNITAIAAKANPADGDQRIGGRAFRDRPPGRRERVRRTARR